ncbi:peptidase, T1 family [Teladorsagia circumcincta]|uniref:proteasome endopeptidase complex n=1 Tax=Teladorsagia circumcincta TaxID=45464 RepID=A0A2G9U8V0_TELCI|nr:peptidase, T1 family [Teladorsagia circumcincta]PIO66671.1 peptidase, T1 family [Teladorsagia circumcincta]
MKILDIGDRMVATMAGGAADCQFWTRTVAKYCNLFELREKTQITVSAASKYFANVLYGYRGMGLSVGSMIAGYDKRGPQIFKVDSDGDRCQLHMCSVGSGSLNAYGILDTHYKPKMTDEEALKLGRRAIMHATYRDTGSGGVCNMVHITPTEKHRLPPIDVSKLWYEFSEELGRDIVYDPRDD